MHMKIKGLHRKRLTKALSPVNEVHLSKYILIIKDMKQFRVEDLNALLLLSLEIIPALVFIHKGGNLLYVNRACDEALGYSRGEILNMPFWEIVHPEHREMVKERALKRLKGEMVPERYEMKVLCKGGVEKWFDMWVKLVELKDGPVILASALDITKLKEKEEALKQLNYELDEIVQERTYKLLSVTKNMETLLYAISHNLKSP